MATVLVLNAGSSSLKFALVDAGTGDRHIGGAAERLGTSEATMQITRDGDTSESALSAGTQVAAVAEIVRAIRALRDDLRPIGVGHRIVHGGDEFTDSVVVTDEVVEAIERFSPLAPLHNPAGLHGIEAVSHVWPDVPQVAVFDTAFHQTMPRHAYRYAVPERWYTDHRVRRYGFHGTSHRYVSTRTAEMLGRDIADVALVVCHLGNGCSAAAVSGGKSVDTTMGLTPLEGLVMGTRSGDIDAGVFGYLEAETDMSSADITDDLNKASGLLGLSGRSNDMRDLVSASAAGDGRAALALEVFVHRLGKHVAGLATSLDRLDAVVFTGGIGENSAEVRSRTLGRLGLFGLEVDPAANDDHGRTTNGRISTSTAPVALVVPTDEEHMIALDTVRLLTAPHGG